LVGTKGESLAQKYIVNTLKEYQLLAQQNPHINSFDIEIQTADGSHRFDFMNQVVMKVYVNITNVIARISWGVECDKNAVLVNAHYDAQMVSPGATDDATGIATMLELSRLVSLRTQPLRNSLVLLFNGAEESLQDASHAFATQSPLAKNIRAFVNVEAMGNSGKEILFQANSRGIVDAYRKVPRPHGSALSNDIFKTGLLLSDTDFRQFVEHGGLVGVDTALYQNSYVYHTMMDTYENIEHGVLQHMGDNTFALVDQLITHEKIEDFTMSRDFIYFDLFGVWFLVYNWTTANLIYFSTIAISILIMYSPTLSSSSSPSFIKNQNANANYSNLDDPIRSFKAFFMSTMATFASFFAAVVLPLLLAVLLQFVLNRPMSYFRNEAYAMVLFGSVAILGVIATQYLFRIAFPPKYLDTPVAQERRLWAGVSIFLILGLALTTYQRLGCSFLLEIHLACMTLGLVVDRLLSPVGNGILGSHRPIHLYAYLVAVVFPTVKYVGHLWQFVNLFVPVTGRIGTDAPVDIVVGVVVGLVFGGHVVFWGGTRSILLGHADPPAMPLIIDSIQTVLNTTPIPLSSKETDHEVSVLFPFSHFVTTHRFDVSHLDVGSRDLVAPSVELVESFVDFEGGTREVTI
ncbi:hypothetical protein HDU76_008496, partial [Blyttiomyces sp. JEL0837]